MMNSGSINKRKNTRSVRIGQTAIGDGSPILIQSMTNTDTRDVEGTVRQIEELIAVGCEIVRVAVPDLEAAAALKDIRRRISIPLVADIHFDYRLALTALESGIDKLRLNPGNIGDEARIRSVVKAAKERKVPIRIGVNSGSLEKDLLLKHGHPSPEAMVESVMRHVSLLERFDFHDIVVSLKSSDAALTVAAYRLISRRIDYPLHLGVTEAGTYFSGAILSSIGIGSLLLDGIGDTIRVSLTAHPKEEIRIGYKILNLLGIRQTGPRFISCPSCGRTSVNLIDLAEKIESELADLRDPVKIAIMGCEVNGPGEAREADIGLACGKTHSLLFHSGRIVKKLSNTALVEDFVREVHAFVASRTEESQ